MISRLFWQTPNELFVFGIGPVIWRKKELNLRGIYINQSKRSRNKQALHFSLYCFKTSITIAIASRNRIIGNGSSTFYSKRQCARLVHLIVRCILHIRIGGLPVLHDERIDIALENLSETMDWLNQGPSPHELNPDNSDSKEGPWSTYFIVVEHGKDHHFLL
jgi:hypothetical protein